VAQWPTVLRSRGHLVLALSATEKRATSARIAASCFAHASFMLEDRDGDATPDCACRVIPFYFAKKNGPESLVGRRWKSAQTFSRS